MPSARDPHPDRPEPEASLHVEAVTNLPGSVTIVGGGVVGCFLAYCLTLAGLPVTVIERDRVGAGASGAAAGNVQAVTDLCSEREMSLSVASLRRWQQLLPAIKEESGVDPLDQEARYFYPATNDRELERAQALHASLQAHGLQTEWLDADAAHALEPRLAPSVLGGMLHHDILQMDPQLFVDALEVIIRARGGRIVCGEVSRLQRHGGRITGLTLQDGTRLPCDALVFSMGAWTGVALSRWLGVSLPIQPYSLEKLHVRPVGEPLRCAVRWGAVNIVSRRDGKVHVGSKHGDNGFEPRTSATGQQFLLEHFHQILPDVNIEMVESAAGLAACLPDPDRIPLVGPLTGFDNVHVAVPTTNGFLFSALMAATLANYLLTGRSDAVLQAMQPERPMSSS